MKPRAAAFWQQHKAIIKFAFIFLCFGSVYALLAMLTPIRIPCVFHKLTGLYCPGCGISRFFIELLRGRVLNAISQNVAVAILLPLWIVIGTVEFFFDPPALNKDSKLTAALLWFTLVFLVLFAILRNIPYFDFLQPGGLY